eukprot:TRINITY_DN9673_c0_g1_i1.p1 TRINITY_DN9673_c0_g1~~TRINITY_DN9673_c0_g1_i1.p1  ORF type:complete len:478 (+),score=89.94 TRINITY_DN9673_c0_g1_i1:42-1436(+)
MATIVSSLIRRFYSAFQSPWEIALLVGLLSLTYVLFMGNSGAHKDGFIGKLLHFILNLWPPPGLRKLKGWFARTIVGRAISKVIYYVLYTPNPLFQLLYIVLLLGGFYLGSIFIWSHMSFVQKVTIHSMIWPSFVLFLICSFRNPGIVTADNVKTLVERYPYDNVMYHRRKKCPTCKLPKPARSKHCSICNKCVRRFDHHCPWINNCVGARNILFFLAFTTMTGITCGYATYLMTSILYNNVILKYRLLEVMYLPRFKDYAHPYVVLMQLLVYYVGPLYMASTTFFFLTFLTLFGFTTYHISLIVRNMTTNETSKIANIKQMFLFYEKRREQKIAKGEPIVATNSKKGGKPSSSESSEGGSETNDMAKAGETMENSASATASSKQQQQKTKQESQKGKVKVKEKAAASKKKTDEEEIQEEEELIEEMRGDVYTINKGKIVMKNIYNRGFKRNFEEVFNETFARA